MSPNNFYTGSGSVKYSLAMNHYAEADNPQLAVNLAARTNGSLILSKYGKSTSLKFRHVAHPQRRSIFTIIESSFPEIMRETATHKFRHVDDISIPSSLSHYVAAAEGLGVNIDLDYSYVDLGGKDLALNLIRLLRGPAKQTFCINEVSSTVGDGKRTHLAKSVLEFMFPYRSSFEK